MLKYVASHSVPERNTHFYFEISDSFLDHEESKRNFLSITGCNAFCYEYKKHLHIF